jgi:exopolyphosphatase/guanosine-5'-triphosphate,3'-diphosphate pyrophosphatase
MQMVSSEAQARVDYRFPLRLAAELEPSGDISESAIHSIIAQIREVHRLYGESSEIHIFGTQALRQARNREAIIDKIRDETAYILKILSAEEEAQAAFRGIQDGLKPQGKVLCFDIGGASTEIMIGSDKGLMKSFSFPLGAVSLSRLIKHEPISLCEYYLLQDEISRQLKFKSPKITSLIGTGGSIVTCAMVALGLPQIDESKVNSFRLRRSEVLRQVQTYRAMKSQEIAKIPGMDPARADIILPACMIMQRLMEICGQEEIITSSRGVRHGLIDRSRGFGRKPKSRTP